MNKKSIIISYLNIAIMTAPSWSEALDMYMCLFTLPVAQKIIRPL